MNLIPAGSISFLPESIQVAWMPITSYPAKEVPFVDEHVLERAEHPARINEHLSSRKLLAELLIHSGWQLDACRLYKEEDGKPFLVADGTRIAVSFSHTRARVMCAISEEVDLGIDCEPMEREIHPQLLSRILTEQERTELTDEPGIGLWTLKEAAVKCMGTGIRFGLKNVQLKKLEPGRFAIFAREMAPMHGSLFKDDTHHIAVAWREQHG